MKKLYKTIIKGCLAIAIFDLVIHIESEPKYILWVNNLVWYWFGCLVSKALYEEGKN